MSETAPCLVASESFFFSRAGLLFLEVEVGPEGTFSAERAIEGKLDSCVM